MKVKEFLKILKNHNLKEFQLETILDVDGRCEITTYEEGEYND